MKRYAFIVLNLEKFWNRFCSQNRAGKSAYAFVRRGVVGPKNAKLLFFYMIHSHKDIRGFADFMEGVTGDSEKLWNSLGHESLLDSYDEYNDFLHGRKKGYIHPVQKSEGIPQTSHNKSNEINPRKRKNAPNGVILNRKNCTQITICGRCRNWQNLILKSSWKSR